MSQHVALATALEDVMMRNAPRADHSPTVAEAETVELLLARGVRVLDVQNLATALQRAHPSMFGQAETLDEALALYRQVAERTLAELD